MGGPCLPHSQLCWTSAGLGSLLPKNRTERTKNSNFRVEKPGKPDLIPDWKTFHRMLGSTPQGHEGHTRKTHTNTLTHTQRDWETITRQEKLQRRDNQIWCDVLVACCSRKQALMGKTGESEWSQKSSQLQCPSAGPWVLTATLVHGHAGCYQYGGSWVVHEHHTPYLCNSGEYLVVFEYKKFIFKNSVSKFKIK